MRTHTVATPDGWKLGLLEYDGGARGTIYLQHGLGSNALNFDLEHAFRPARWLAQRGWRVFAGSLRGRAPGEPHGGRSWTFSDCETDARALAGRVAELAGPFHWVGHSLGGILGLRLGGPILSLTTLGSALNYSEGGSVFPRLLPLRRLPMPAVLPARLGHMALAPVIYAAGRLYRRLDWCAARSFHANQGDLSSAELRELADVVVAAPRPLPEVKAPWLCVAGSHDSQCPPATARWTYERVAAPRKRWLLMEGFAHVDLAIGRGAEAVWSAVETAILAA